VLKDRLGRLGSAVANALEQRQLRAAKRQAEETQRQAEEKYRSIFENAVYGIYRATLDGTFLSVNPALVAMLGYAAAEELLHVRMSTDLFCDPNAYLHWRTQLQQTGQIKGVEVAWKRQDGTPLTVRLSGRAVQDEQGTQDVVEVFVEDITEHRALEEQFRQAQKMESIGRLAGGMAHDFNNLLTVIMGYTDLMLRQLAQDAPLRASIEQVRKAGERAAALTRQLLAFSRKQVLQPAVLDLNLVITDSAKMLRRLIGEDMTLITALAPTLSSVKADPGQIEQVLMNLVVNARDAMPQGGKLIIETANVVLDEDYARRHVSVHPGAYVLLAVSDTGCGMNAETMSHIFEPFFTTKKQGQEGTGLGLSTVYGIVKQSGGHIWVYSEPDHGTTLKIYLPAVAEPAAREKDHARSSESPYGSETILVVEDEESVRELACEALRIHHYCVLEAANGREALLLCEQHKGPIHLLVTDVVLPHMSGRELVDQLACSRPEMQVLYTSGYTDSAMVHHGLLSISTNFLQQPFTVDALARKVREVLDAPRMPGGQTPPGR
jgi:PAS domain S-box-containing protein